jgi:hypothetical protein
LLDDLLQYPPEPEAMDIIKAASDSMSMA